jgi:hypothetical protein
MIYRHDARPSVSRDAATSGIDRLSALDLGCLELSFFRKKFKDRSRAFIGRVWRKPPRVNRATAKFIQIAHVPS